MADSVEKGRRTVWTDHFATKTIGGCCALVAGTFQEMVRAEHADRSGECTCVCCGRRHPWKGTGRLNSGHYFSRRHRATMFDERNVHPVCSYCNTRLGGNLGKHREYIIATFGQEEFDALDALHNTTKQWTRDELIEMRIEFARRLDKAKSRLAQGLPGKEKQ